ncbi:MAG: AraC family transcriptional regulator [Eubacteriales bacterium]
MRATEQGVCPGSYIYFSTPTVKAQGMYFYTLSIGHYFCNNYYHVRRHIFESFLVMYIRNGSGYVEQEGQVANVNRGDVVFLNCHKPHAYYTDRSWEIEWIHFDGAVAKAYFEEATANGFVFHIQNPYHCIRTFRQMFADYHQYNRVNEAVHSKHITSLLTELILLGPSSTTNPTPSSGMEEISSYLAEHASEELQIEDLAKKANLSPFHFIRVFKKETGFTPHEYLIRVRMNLAKFYLKSTDQPLKEIAYRVGYQRESSFCSAFKKMEGMTPGAYRKQLSPPNLNSDSNKL